MPCFRKICCIHFFILFVILFYVVSTHAESRLEFNLAFYYGKNPPVNKLKFYKNIVVEPLSGIDPRHLSTNGRTVFAYASLGEVKSLNQYGQPIDKRWVIGQNNNWHTLALDQSNPAWQRFFLDQVITPLWEKGYRGFFLDTLDSYRFGTTDPGQMKKQQEGMILTIRSIKQKYPTVKLITNRGFEILPQIRPLIDGVVAESLFAGWDNKRKRYFMYSQKSTQQGKSTKV